jgi:signal transduction histidine kinase/CheY-like chemotaxis protein
VNEPLRELAVECSSALQEYLAEPREACLAQAYELGRRALALPVDVMELGFVHENVLATALPDADTAEERTRIAQRAAEFLSEVMAPFEMVLRGYREANVLLQRLNKTLEQQVQERTAALRASEERYRDLAEELQQAGRRKDDFLAVLAHELRNPLAPLRNALSIMRLRHYDAGAVGQASTMMERQVQHLVRLIDDLLDVSRIARGKLELRKERVDLAKVVQCALDISRPHIEAARHELIVVLPPQPLIVDADPARLAQVVANLLNNASKYTEPGGRIELTVAASGALAVVRVRDTGLGIPAEMLPRIFDPFVQVPSALERAQGGLGIGLALVKSLVEMHGGRVEVHSAGHRQGSEFILHLPLVPGISPSQPSKQCAPEEKATELPALRLLVVDDNQEAASSLSTLLQLVGYEVRVAYDGPEALELARTFQPQVVLQDLQMPGMSGYEVARILRVQFATQKVLLVALTGYGGDEDRRRCLEAGFDHHLVKPVDPCLLQAMLASCRGLS